MGTLWDPVKPRRLKDEHCCFSKRIGSTLGVLGILSKHEVFEVWEFDGIEYAA